MWRMVLRVMPLSSQRRSIVVPYILEILSKVSPLLMVWYSALARSAAEAVEDCSEDCAADCFADCDVDCAVDCAPDWFEECDAD